MTARLCLIDGTFELFRAYYGAPSRTSAAGSQVGAAVALGRSLGALARSREFTHLAVAFDTVIESFRNDLFAGYKTGEGIEPALFSQFPLAEEVIDALGLVVLSMREFEADDGLATLAARFEHEPAFDSIVIASPDKDLMQCVTGSRIVTWDRLRNVRYDEAGVKSKLGVLPPSIPDYLALVGDSADGIPGIPRWGARSASVVLDHYGHLESIPRSVAEWTLEVRGADALVRELRAHEPEALLYRTLATLRRDVPLSHTIADLAYRGPDASKLAVLEERWGPTGLVGSAS